MRPIFSSPGIETQLERLELSPRSWPLSAWFLKPSVQEKVTSRHPAQAGRVMVVTGGGDTFTWKVSW